MVGENQKTFHMHQNFIIKFKSKVVKFNNQVIRKISINRANPLDLQASLIWSRLFSIQAN